MRPRLLQDLQSRSHYDLVVIGGGATGLGIALDAQTRGLQVALLEAQDFAQGTSSRSTKLLHGGVRYLAQGNIGLVRQALHERTTVLRNAPHVAQPLAFIMPCYRWWEAPFYGLGLTLYDALAGASAIQSTRWLSAATTAATLPGVRSSGLKAGIQFWDGQFDDARFAIALARTAQAAGAVLLNHCKVSELLYQDNKVCGVLAQDQETGLPMRIHASCVVNATGVWVDALRQSDAQSQGTPCEPMLAPSQGVHLVVGSQFWPGDKALLIPSTADGRVLFAVPWQGKVILGTTDTARKDLPQEPQALAEEIDFILRESARYLRRAPQRSDVSSVWAGLRPLVRPQAANQTKTGSISREHTVLVSNTGLVTVTGGKWTTYRAMAQDVLEQCFNHALLPRSAHGHTAALPLLGSNPAQHSLTQAPGEHLYGDQAQLLASLPGANRYLAPGLSEAMIRFAARYEFARSTQDCLARRSRLLFLDAALAIAIAPQVAAVLHEETGRDPALDEFLTLAKAYLIPVDPVVV